MKSPWSIKRWMSLAAAAFFCVLLLMAAGQQPAAGSVRGVYVGDDFYAPVSHAAAVKASGFNALFLFALHVYANGDLYYNGTLLVQNGAYVGDAAWGSQLAALRPAVNRVEMVIGGWGDPSFTYIKNLIATNGTGAGGILYKNFQALKNATGVDAIQYDDEQTYDSASAAAFGNLIARLGMKVTLCPYTAQSFWTSVKSQLGTNVDAIYLQCYDGGAGNASNVGAWNSAFGRFKVYPGLWGNTSDAPTVTATMRNWQQTLGITGGFLWLNGGLPSDAQKWGQALAFGLDPLYGLIAEDFATNYFVGGFTGNNGFGFGPWTLSTAGGGSYISGGSPALFGIWNSAANGKSTATRPLNSPLAAGQAFLAQLKFNTLDGPNYTNAFQLKDAGGNVLFGYYHVGGDNANGHCVDAAGDHVATGFAYNYGQLNRFMFVLNTGAAYTFTDLSTGASVSGTLSGAAISQVTFLRANGSSATINNGNDFNFNGLVIYTPTNLPVALAGDGSNWKLNFPATPGLTYRVQRAASVAGPWTDIASLDALFNTAELTDTNPPAGRAFYRTVTP
jgi:hypothetical protein